VLGSAITLLTIDDVGRTRRVVFTSDLGRVNMLIIEDPQIPDDVELLITKSTYGDRLHDDIEKMDGDLAEGIARTHARGGKVIIPSFALERAQEIVVALKQLKKEGRLPSMPTSTQGRVHLPSLSLSPACVRPAALSTVCSLSSGPAARGGRRLRRA